MSWICKTGFFFFKKKESDPDQKIIFSEGEAGGDNPNPHHRAWKMGLLKKRLLTKIVGSRVGTGSVSKRYESADPDQNVTDPQHCFFFKEKESDPDQKIIYSGGEGIIPIRTTVPERWDSWRSACWRGRGRAGSSRPRTVPCVQAAGAAGW